MPGAGPGAYTSSMRKGRALPTFVFHALFIACALTLVVAIVAAGAGMLAVLAVFTAIVLFFLAPSIPAEPAPLHARSRVRRSFPRAPPRF